MSALTVIEVILFLFAIPGPFLIGFRIGHRDHLHGTATRIFYVSALFFVAAATLHILRM